MFVKDDLVEGVSLLLLKKGFTVKQLPRKWFDIVARNGSRILIIKVLADANSISSELAGEMKRICFFLKATPLVIAEKAAGPLEEGVVYQRFGIYTVSVGTLASCLDNKLPFVTRRNSGLTVSIIGERFSRMMEELRYSLSDVSRKVGVSRQMVVRYKADNSEISVERAEAVHDLFGESVFEKVDILSCTENHVEEGRSVLARKYGRLGFRAVDTRKAPFDIIAKSGKDIILTEVGDRHNAELESITRLIDADKLIIFDRKKPKERDIPKMSKQEFLDMSTSDELIRFLREFR